MPASDPETPAEAIVATAEAVETTAAAPDEAAEVMEITAEAADAHDEAMLELVALEMAAPEVSEIGDAADPDPDEIHALEPQPAEPIIVAREPEPIAAPEPPPEMPPSLQPSFEGPVERPLVEHSPVESSLETSLEASLGSTLIASGIVTKPSMSAADPLAPIRRMSQAEKIALFS
jgi:hypothetical protein